MKVDSVDVVMPEAYHKGRPSRSSSIPAELKRFIAWDGEGMNLRGKNKPQSYVLFGCSTGEYVEGASLGTFELLDFIVEVGRKNPDAFHVGFAFSYDANMIVKSLHTDTLRVLHKNGSVRIPSPLTGYTYVITFKRGKSLTVTRRDPEWSEKNNQAKTTVTIYDMFGFFMTTFVKAAEDMLGMDAENLDVVREGKAERPDFTLDDMAYVKRYWTAEIKMLAAVAEELRTRMWNAGLRIKEWYGPGALASYAMRQHGIKKHMAKAPDAVREAARYAYAGGRFELYKVGRITGPIYGIDINSAYPYAISQLPSLSEGFWQYVESPKRVARFGVYHIRMRLRAGFTAQPGPVFHRDETHNISYPWIAEGWYWSPEVARLINSPGVEIVAGWEYIGSESQPFAWVAGMYEKRREWKFVGNASQLALKLCMNSLYGKMAQRVGWDEKNNRLPPFHQLEWAGWVTSYTRSMLYHIMRRIAWPDLIGVETDGIYTLTDPAKLGIENSKELGGWEITQYDEILYIQSGMAFLRQGDKWTTKYRGLDKDSFSVEQARDYVKSLQANPTKESPWLPFIGRTTRFIGLGAALAGNAPPKTRHCVWSTIDREIMPGERGKRIHVGGSFCAACKEGASAYDKPHDLLIRSKSRAGQMSTPHFIPWEGKDSGAAEPDWREYEEVQVNLHAYT